MDKRDKTLIVVAIIVCIIICCLAPFIASENPDGLEKSAEDANVSEEKATVVITPPFPDYTFEPFGGVGVLILGTILTLLCGWGIAEILKRRS